jgi:hypothetical protein
MAVDRPRPYSEEPARYPLMALSAATCSAVITGTFTYAYPETLKPILPQMRWVHDVSGDAMLATGAVYLYIHLQRTFRLGKLALSWWSGIAVACVFAASGATGVYGQARSLLDDESLYWTHIICSIALVAGACFHGANGLRRRLR